MKKIYISPLTDVYNVNLRSGIMASPGQAGEQVNISEDLPDLTPGVGSDPGVGGEWDDDDLSRNSNGGNIWDNIW